MPEVISSVQNPRIKNLVRLRTGSHRRRQQRFLVEGYREITRALACDWPIESLFFCEELFMADGSFDLLHHAEEHSVELVQVAADPFLKAAYRQGADGLLAVSRHKQATLDGFHPDPRALIVIVESIEKPGNLGAVFRTADAAGAQALMMTGQVTDPHNPNCIRSSQGAFFSLPFYSADTPELLEWLGSKGFQVITTSPSAKKLLWDADMTGATAIVLGSEDNGLSNDWLDAHEPCKLPMYGITDSLNIASTAAITLFEAVRQRTSRQLP